MNKKQIHHIKGNLSSRKKQYNYPGQLVIDGDIEPGCQVSAETIDVQNVFQADVRVRSGIRVHGHIEDTDIFSSQGAEVKSVINSSIRAGDTIRVHEKIFQSDIFTNAACLALDAVIESSNIMACQCIDAHTIISSEQIPCTLTFGLICPDDQDHKLRTDYLKMEAQKKQLQDKLANAEQTIKDTLQLKNKIRSIKPSIKEKIINLKKNKDYQALRELAPFFKQLNERVETAFHNYQAAIADKDEAINQIESFDQEQLDITKKNYLLRKKDRVDRSEQLQTTMTPYIQVKSLITQYTRIQGLHSFKRLLEDMKNVRIEEVNIEGLADAMGRYEIQVRLLLK